VLEVGCGTGNYIAALALITGCQGWGIDPSSEMLARARHRLAGESQSHVKFSLGRAERLGQPRGIFGLVFSVDVIHHVQDRVAYVHEARRVLCPGGALCTATDTERIIRHREPLARYWPETVEVELARYPRIALIKTLYSEAGFDRIESETVEHRAVLTDIQAYRDKAFSVLHQISQAAYQRGLARLEQALRSGPIPSISRYALLWGVKP
jgi:ubiquinone/menaquinone biosynthesis C-methylase UbiE